MMFKLSNNALENENAVRARVIMYVNPSYKVRSNDQIKERSKFLQILETTEGFPSKGWNFVNFVSTLLSLTQGIDSKLHFYYLTRCAYLVQHSLFLEPSTH